VVLVGLGARDEAEAFQKEYAPHFPVICDPDKELYRAYNLSRGTLASMASPGVFIKGLRTMARGHMPGIPRGDRFQLAGVFLIDTEGSIRYSRFAKDPADNPSIESLLALRSLIQGDKKKRD
jgi:peroxiredoxin